MSGEIVAIKIIQKNRLKAGDIETVVKEVCFLQKLHSGSVTKFIDFCYDENNYYIITDYYQMNLLHYINRFHDKLSEKKVRDIFRKIAEALAFCHDSNILHCDLKPENILINMD